MCNMIVDGIAYSFGVFMPTLAADLHSSKGSASWIGSLLSGVYLSAGNTNEIHMQNPF